ncbi:tRNA epoxyqueuosine(34) reductase QueG [Terriglobus roseus]|uniref:Epoxyqueuosine reductase n=1 Tax=Terriglobus roseus TaxID=392734 RepID=A0A1H4IWL2_9BACT|nr:tRNA epoxyqueuosine(34) reductase QueG [Terriglobus roseus]SEB38521.1 epoxyqueuosine reductase [Terriglobus roseus]
MITPRLREQLVARALCAGFDLAGVAAVPERDSPQERLQSERFTEWARAGFAGDMAWMLRADADGVPLRSSLQRAVPWARSVVLCAVNYNSAQPRSVDAAPAGAGWIARYAWSGTGTGEDSVPTDYHEVLLARLKQVEADLHATVPAGEEAIQTRCYVDTGPVVERWFAQLAGIGWIGKNTCVLNQGQGSWMLLGVLLTSLPLSDEAVLLPTADRCGTCTRCIDACPTDALIAPRKMDASRCIAYLTIEKKGSIDESLRPQMGRQVFGCDICQDVCPWNRRAPIGTAQDMQARTALVNPSLEDLAAIDTPEFKRRFRGSPLERTGRRRLQRNVAIAMGNSHDACHVPRLEAWAAGEDEMLREAALWALEQIAGSATSL